VKTFAKAIVGGATALIGSLATAATEGGIALNEWLTAITFGLAAFGAVYGVKNAPPNSSTDSGE